MCLPFSSGNHIPTRCRGALPVLHLPRPAGSGWRAGPGTPLPVLRELQASGAESITFVTNLKTTTLSLSALLALGGEDDEAQLLHTGDVPTLTVGGTVHNELL